ncbi:sigma 54-interacting transcriptional regulator [Sporomusa malonica]|uniref:PAS domain S-box-containing protein n=1 Tax=Sporomusa malonica TaxID=112901 RepID=A0A1W1YA64_9FIRM|nr:sigma 54-interacting transcriptional regulator [Sporomusa malonica]SMC33110.1 PAS domain S-box-containing protein [Sporomusa malonica]
MGKIAFLAPHAPMGAFIKEVIAPYERIHVEYCPSYDQMIDFAAKLIEQGYEIIIARAGTASRIKNSDLNVTVVELPVTGFDIIRAVTAAKTYGPNIAIVAFAAMVKGIDCLIPIFGSSLKQYLTERDDADAETMVLEAIQDGADVVVGGGLFCQAAQKHELPAVFIENGKEAILQAAEEALRIEAAIETEKIKRSLFAAVLDYVHDGIITVDCQQKITSINMRAQQVFNLSPTKALGQNIGAVWPGLNLSELIRTEQEDISKLLQVKGLKVICNKVPIIVNSNLTGALVTFQEISKIQQTEAHIRKELYNKGHIARKSFADVWGTSSSIARAITLAKEFAATNSNILIVGETGTGKEVFAQSIHNHSPRSAGPFVAVNCAALPAQILESELFGYVGGAFTGANKEGKPGLFELAHGGTIFLDEIAEMDYTNQSRLLRVLQERSVMRLGSDRVIAVNTRVIAATNKDLKELIRTNRFREDLFFRLNVLKLELPPLRERQQDIRIIAENFINKYALSGRTLKLDTQAMKALESYGWPGNVRELQNTIERLMAFCQTEAVRASDITAVLEKWDVHPVKNAFYDEEIQEITDALIKAKGVQTVAAKLLGIDRTTLWRKMRKLGIQL